MPQCAGITTRGGQCKLSASDRFGSQYCHHHCGEYYRNRGTEIEDRMHIQKDHIKDLEARLSELIRANPNSELAKVSGALNAAHADFNKSHEELKKLFKEEMAAMREDVKKQGELTRDTINEGHAKLEQQNTMIMQVLWLMLNSEPTSISSGTLPIASGEQTLAISHKPHEEITRPGDAYRKRTLEMTNDELGDTDHVETFIREMLEINDKYPTKCLEDPEHEEHESAIEYFNEILTILQDRAHDNGLLKTFDLIESHRCNVNKKRKLNVNVVD